MARSFSRGTSDNIAYGHYGALDGASQVALSMWVYPTASTSYDTWLTQSDGSNGVTLQHRTTAAGRVFVSARNASTTPSGYTTSTTALTVNQWNHLVVQFDGTQVTAAARVTVYCNGAAFALTLAGTWPTTLGATAADLKLGTDWTGRLADVAIWNGVVLSPSEIAQLANCRAPDVVRPRGLMFYADLRKGTSDAIAKLPGTVSGTTLIDHPDRIIRPTAVRRRLYVDLGGGGPTTVNETLSFGTTASLIPSGQLTVAETLGIAVAAGVAPGQNAIVGQALQLAISAGMNPAHQLITSLTLQLATSHTLPMSPGDTVVDETLSLGGSFGVGLQPSAVAAHVLAYQVAAGLTAANRVTVANALALDLAALIGHQNNVQVQSSLAMAISAVLLVASENAILADVWAMLFGTQGAPTATASGGQRLHGTSEAPLGDLSGWERLFGRQQPPETATPDKEP